MTDIICVVRIHNYAAQEAGPIFPWPALLITSFMYVGSQPAVNGAKGSVKSKPLTFSLQGFEVVFFVICR